MSWSKPYSVYGDRCEESRVFTNRELAWLQTLPDNFYFLGSKEKVLKQIGMAVPPTDAEIVFEAILKTFVGVDYESIGSTAKLQL